MEPTIHIENILPDVFVLHNFWSKQRCEEFMDSIKNKNFENNDIINSITISDFKKLLKNKNYNDYFYKNELINI